MMLVILPLKVNNSQWYQITGKLLTKHYIA